MKKEEIKKIKNGAIAVIKTDTLYGICGSALNKKTVEKIYSIKKRNKSKPFIVLIPSIISLKKFDVKVSTNLKKFLDKIWPGPISVLLPIENKKFEYLTRGTKKIAFRVPDKKDLVAILKKTGPMVAPSANTEDCESAKNIARARKYFGDKVEIYKDKGKTSSSHSIIIDILRM